MSYSSSFIRRLLIVVLLLVASITTLLPFWVMLITSLSRRAEMFNTLPLWLTEPPAWENYQQLFERLPFGQYFLNSLWVAVATTIGQVVLCAMAGYAFARFQFPHKTLWFFAVLLTLMIPPQINIVPLFLMMKTFGWLDGYAALIVPGLFGGFGVFLFRQWFSGFPGELEDAACLDGCTPWQTFWLVAWPLATPAVISLSLFTFIASWNSFLWPLIVTNSEALRTLPVGIAAFKGSFRETTDWPLLMAASTVSILPLAVLFVLGQRYFIEGLMAGGVKE